MNKEIIVNENSELLLYLRSVLTNKSKNNIKTFINKQMVKVNENIVTDIKYNLKKGDKILICTNFIYDKNIVIKIIYEDKDILVVEKPENLLTIATKKEKEKTLYNIVRNYVASKNKYNKIFIIHRLDKGTSGVIMFAKNMNAKNIFQNNWDKLIKNKEYYAVCSSNIKEEGIIKTYLTQNKEGIVYSTSNKKEGKIAITKYKKITSNKKYALVKVNILTGRKNQIRVHLSEINSPIVGDDKYGVKNSKTKRLFLHAYKLEIFNPILNKKQVFISDLPKNFEKMSVEK